MAKASQRYKDEAIALAATGMNSREIAIALNDAVVHTTVFRWVRQHQTTEKRSPES